MVRARNEIEHDIWVAAYLRALREAAPLDAEAQAIDAARRYQGRWDRRYKADSFDAVSYRAGSPMSAEHEEEEDETAFSVLRCPEDYAADDAEAAMVSDRPDAAVDTSATFPVSLPVLADKVS